MKNSKWKMVIQILISILTALGTTLGTTSCMGKPLPCPSPKKRGAFLLNVK